MNVRIRLVKWLKSNRSGSEKEKERERQEGGKVSRAGGRKGDRGGNCTKFPQKKWLGASIESEACNPNTWETKARGSIAPDQSKLHSETDQKTKNKKIKRKSSPPFN